MSKNMIVNCRIDDRALLEEILSDLGIPFKSGVNLPLCGYDGTDRPETADVVIDRRAIRLRFPGSPNDLGFRFANGRAQIVISEYDDPRDRPGRAEYRPDPQCAAVHHYRRLRRRGE